jgi:hypothetical protein
MYDEDKLRRTMLYKGHSPRQVSKLIKMDEKTFYRKMKRGSWGLDEVKAIQTACDFSMDEIVDLFLS